MKRIVTLLAVLAALIGLIFYSQGKRDKTMSKASSMGAAMRELLLPDLSVPAVQKVRIKDTTGELTVEVAGDKWTVKERDGYPASFDKIKRVVAEIAEQKISSGQPLGKTAWAKPEVKVEEPGKGDAAGQGLLVEFQDAKGNVLESLVLGANVESSGGRSSASPFGGGSSMRFVRVPKDGEKNTIWVVNNSFYDVQPKPADWIDKAFIDVQRLKAVEITPATAPDAWKASRKAAEGDDSNWKLDEAKPAEVLDDGKAAVAGLLGNGQFTDIATKDKTSAADFWKDAVKAKLTTFDNFTYNVEAVKKGKDTDEKFYLKVTSITADIAKERKPEKDEKPEDKKKKDDEFAAQKKTFEEKLAKEKKAEGWTYEVASSTVTALMKKRAEVLKDKPEEPKIPADAATKPGILPPPGTPVVPPPSAPKPAAEPVTPEARIMPPDAAPAKPVVPAADLTRKPISVTTPPISVPPLPKDEIKPALDPKANPATPNAPAPPPPAEPKK